MKEYLEDSAHVLAEVKSDETAGISSAEAAARLERDGLNKLKEAEKTPVWKRFFAQMADPIIMPIVAAVISALTGLAQGDADFADVIIICFVVVVNAVLGVVQESKAEEALAALQEMSAAQSKVVRDGQLVTVLSSELVVGDVVVLEAGDAVPADCRILESASMKIEEAALTGESVPANKVASVLTLSPDSDDVALGDRKNMCYMGSTVVYGRGRAVVVATGMKTEMGKIADALSQATDEETPLQKKLDELSKILSIGCIVICALVFVVTWIKHGTGFFSNMPLVLNTFMVAVSLAVAAIPEGLAAVVTIVLSIGVTKMSEHHAIIRKLSAVETLGCTQIICSDKTGTLTQNKMTVVHHYTEDQDRLMRCMALCSDAKWDDEKQEAVGEPTEAALVADAAKLGFTTGDLDAANPRAGEAPFDSGRKMMSVVNVSPDGNYIQHTKGGPDVVLARCTTVRTADGDVPLTGERRKRIMEANKAMADDALRVMAAARVNYGKTAPADYSAEALEHDMCFLGLCGMIDPVRPEVKDAVAEAHNAGIRVVMITGDHIDTAVAIAKELGIAQDRSQAITGAELDKISDEGTSSTTLRKYSVYARVQPEHKTCIVDTWKKKDKVVAMTGDGVNVTRPPSSAPTSASAWASRARTSPRTWPTWCSRTTTSPRSSAQQVRRVAASTRTSGSPSPSCSPPTSPRSSPSSWRRSSASPSSSPRTCLLNLVTDCFPALAMAMEDAEPGLTRRKPRSSTDGIFANGMGLDCIVQGIFIGALTLISHFIGLHVEGVPLSAVLSGADKGLDGMTMAFLTLSMVEMFHSFNMRSRRESVFKLPTQNKARLWASFAAALFLTFVVIETPLAKAFDFARSARTSTASPCSSPSASSRPSRSTRPSCARSRRTRPNAWQSALTSLVSAGFAPVGWTPPCRRSRPSPTSRPSRI